MKKYILLVVFILSVSCLAHAKGASQFMPAIRSEYSPAKKSKALETAIENLDLSTVNSFVVLNQGGIPAERASHFISWDDYDYRGTNIDLEENKITTRRGKVYTYLQRGDVLAVADVFSLGRKIYFKLITPKVYIPWNRKKDDKHSRVTLTLIFKLPKNLRDLLKTK